MNCTFTGGPLSRCSLVAPFCVLFFVLLLANPSVSQAALVFSAFDDPSATSGTSPRAISNGIIAGYFTNVTGSHGFIFDGTQWKTLDVPNATTGTTVATGYFGGVTIGTFTDSTGISRGFSFDGKVWNTLDFPGAIYGTYPSSISGQTIVGSYGDPTGRHGFSLNNGTWTTLQRDPTNPTFITGVSGNVVVGYDGVGPWNGIEYDGNNWSLLRNPLSPNSTFPTSIDGGNIVGIYNDDLGQHGFLYNNNNWTTVDDPVAIQGTTLLWSISNQQAVGQFRDGTGTHGFLVTIPEPMPFGLATLSFFIWWQRRSRRPANLAR
jgi:hypothetical protein